MTNDLTTREVSQRLLQAGFDETRESVWYKGKIVSVEALMEYALEVDVDFTEVYPAYSASTLFEWLRAKYHSDPNLALDIQATEITIWLNIGHNPDEEEKEFEYKTSLADMLGESIIWILTQEKENK